MADMVLKLDPEVIVGTDTVTRAGTLCARKGHRALLVTDPLLNESKTITRLSRILEDAGLEAIQFDEIPGQATADAAENAAYIAKGARCDMVIGCGGLKTQYTARLISVLAASSLSLFDMLDGGMEEGAFIPYAAIPTTGGDPFLFSDQIIAVDPRDRSVKLVKCPRGLCSTVILDSSLLEPLSIHFASAAVLDGLCTSLEAYCSTKSSFFSDAVLEQAIALYAQMIHSYAETSSDRAGGSLPVIGAASMINQVSDITAAQLHAGFLLSLGASASTPGIGTALAYAINGKFPVAKFSCSAVLLPHVMEKLTTARPEKMAKAAALINASEAGISGDSAAKTSGALLENATVAETANMGVDIIRRRMGQLQIPARLKDFNLSLDRLVPASEAAKNLEFVAFSPWTVTAEDSYDLLKQAF